jgi:acetyl esterase/lipase
MILNCLACSERAKRIGLVSTHCGAMVAAFLLIANVDPLSARAQNATAKQDAPAAKVDAPVKADTRKPTIENVSYGPHQRNVFDLWLAKSDKPTPLLIFIHGGGFVNGDKGGIRNNPAVAKSLAAGVSFASLNYRFREHAPIQDILRDAARAVQTIRSRAKEWNIDPDRIASYGGSAGAGTSLWLAFHDDLADPNASDPVLRQSSRLTAAGSLEGQASYDLREWAKFLGPSEFQRPTDDWISFYGFKSEDETKTEAAEKIMKDCSMLGLISKDDPPVAVACTFPSGEFKDRGHYVHHPKHSTAIAERCKENGVECLAVLAGDTEHADSDRAKQQQRVVDFLIEKLKAPAATK